MCETSTFYHLCGHVNKHKDHFCSACIHKRIEQRIYSPISPKIKRPPSRCDPASTYTYLVPTLCKSCTDNSEVSQYLEKDPTARFEITRSWKASLRFEKVKATAEAEGRAAWKRTASQEEDDSSSAESMPFISLSEISSSASVISSRTSFVDTETEETDTKAVRRTEETRGRIAALKGRVVKALASVTY